MVNYTGFDLAFRATTLKAAAQMDISSIFSASTGGHADGFALLFDAMLTTDDYKKVTLPSGLEFVKRQGTGLRVAMKMVDVTAEVKLTFAAVAAQTKLGYCSTSYQVHGIGISEKVVLDLLKMPLNGDMNELTFKAIRQALAETLPSYLESADVGVGEYSVPLPTFDDDPSAQARAICYAAAMIARRHDLGYALAHRPPNILPEAITVVYARILRSVDTNKPVTPTPDQAEMAGRWLATGSFEPSRGPVHDFHRSLSRSYTSTQQSLPVDRSLPQRHRRRPE